MPRKYNTAVTAARAESKTGLDYFPTPPWGTRALLEMPFMKERLEDETVWEPAAGGGHMSRVLKEYAGKVIESDIADYGMGYEIRDFLKTPPRGDVDWVITNPPFKLAEEFIVHSLKFARCAMLLRTQFVEGGQRYYNLFSNKPPHRIVVFSSRLAMTKNRVDPNASSATSYSWFVWESTDTAQQTTVHWFPPDAKPMYTLAGDYDRDNPVARQNQLF